MVFTLSSKPSNVVGLYPRGVRAVPRDTICATRILGGIALAATIALHGGHAGRRDPCANGGGGSIMVFTLSSKPSNVFDLCPRPPWGRTHRITYRR